MATPAVFSSPRGGGHPLDEGGGTGEAGEGCRRHTGGCVDAPSEHDATCRDQSEVLETTSYVHNLKFVYNE